MEILTADIGGTHSRFALFQVEGEGPARRLRLTAEKWPATKAYPSFAALTAGLMHPKPFYNPTRPPALAVLAVAGPVENGRFCAPPNIPWDIRVEDAHLPGIPPITLCNDFEAQAWAALWGREHPKDVDMLPVLPGTAKPDAPMAVIGAGTGLGKALALWPTAAHDAPRILPSEGGHAGVPFTAEDGEFPRFLAEQTGRAVLDGDTVLGGAGLALLAAFYTGKRPAEKEAPALVLETPAAFRHYASLYGRVCRDFVLDTLALNGLVVTGGIAARLPVTAHPAFAEAFRFCPGLPGLMDSVPVFHMRAPTAGLYGAARLALTL